MIRSFRTGIVALFVGVLLVSAVSVATAQIPRLISYQGLLTQPTGLPIADGQYGLVLRLFDAPVGGNLVWEETQQTVRRQSISDTLLLELSDGFRHFECFLFDTEFSVA
ncbi:MAG: hypothetical protein NTX15_00790 [Candidatus Kapabacteria bacterium]|nr:hypothetical protein [Candidatus Kapabacteria bacterium]